MSTIKRAVAAGCLGLALLVTGAGGGSAAEMPPPASGVPVSQCNGDPGYDPSRDPIDCHYDPPLPPASWGQDPDDTPIPAPDPAPAPKK
jgi:hypothetical protein